MSVMRPKAQPVRNSITIATPLDTRRAGPALSMTMKGITTGKVERKTTEHASGTQPVVLAQARARRRLRQLDSR